MSADQDNPFAVPDEPAPAEPPVTDPAATADTTEVRTGVVAAAALVVLLAGFVGGRTVPSLLADTPVTAGSEDGGAATTADVPQELSEADRAAAELAGVSRDAPTVRIPEAELDQLRSDVGDLLDQQVTALVCNGTSTQAAVAISDTDLLVNSTSVPFGAILTVSDDTTRYAAPVAIDDTATLLRATGPHGMPVAAPGEQPAAGEVALAGNGAIRIGTPADGPLATTSGGVSPGSFVVSADGGFLGRVRSRADGDRLDPSLPEDAPTPPATAPADDPSAEPVSCHLFGSETVLEVEPAAEEAPDDHPQRRLHEAAGVVSRAFSAINLRDRRELRANLQGDAAERFDQAFARDVFVLHRITADSDRSSPPSDAGTSADQGPSEPPDDVTRHDVQVTRIRPDADQSQHRCLTYTLTLEVDHGDGELTETFRPDPPADATPC